MSARVLGSLAAFLVFVLDRISKSYVIQGIDLPLTGPIRLGPIEFVMVWNRGISYGLFQQHEDWGRWGLIILSVLAAMALSVWMARSPGRLVALALGLLIGGALGNALDRVLYGAVADFILLWWIPFFPYVFNIADSAIVAGVTLLLYDSFFGEGRTGQPVPVAPWTASALNQPRSSGTGREPKRDEDE